MKPSPGPRTARPMSSRFSAGTASSRSVSRSPPAKPGARDRAGVERRARRGRRRSGSGCRARADGGRPVTAGSISSRPMRSRPTSISMSGSSGAFGIAGPQRRQPAEPRLAGCRASGCRYGCGDRRTADSRARPPARGRRRPADRRASAPCRVSSPNTEPSIRSTWTCSPETVSKALIWRTMKRRPGSVFSQSRKAPSSSDDAEQERRRPFGDGHGRVAAADDDRLAPPSEGLPDRDVDVDPRFARPAADRRGDVDPDRAEIGVDPPADADPEAHANRRSDIARS